MPVNVTMFYHSLVSDWNHGNAHFLRGVVAELQDRGHHVRVFEPDDGWSRQNAVREHGDAPLRAFRERFPGLSSETYDPGSFDLERMLEAADLVIVHEWNEPELVQAIGDHRRRTDAYRLLFHDTHHRLATAPAEMERYDLSHYDAVLAYGEALRQLYLQKGVAERVFTWHEAADTRVFQPMRHERPSTDLVWIGNWGDDERAAELREFLIEPVGRLGLAADVHGVRYPEEARRALAEAGIRYHGWLPNHEVPAAFGRSRVTVHVPRRPYVDALPGIPTIRVFEALACAIPLVCALFEDVEGLFEPGADYLRVEDGEEMEEALRTLTHEPEYAAELAASGRRRILARHTCGHRVDALLEIARELGVERTGRDEEAA